MAKLGFNVASKAAEEAQKSTRQKFDYFKTTDEAKQIRLITIDGEKNSILTYGEHYVVFKNGWSRSFSCPDFDGEGERKCLICSAKKGPGHDILRDDYGTKFIMQLLDREDSKVKVHKFSSFLWTTYAAYFEEYGDLGDRDYTIALIREKDDKGKVKPRYEVMPVTKKAAKLTEEDLAILETRNQLTDIEPPYNEADILSIMQKEASSDAPVSRETIANKISNFLGDSGIKKPTAESLLGSLTTKPANVAEAKEAEAEAEDEDETDFFKTLKKSQPK